MKDMADVAGKTIFIVGGSGGLGKEISKVLAAQGAHITIFARKQKLLEEAREEILAARENENQIIMSVAADMAIHKTAYTILNSQPRSADILYCVAGGTPNECGFLVDLEPEVMERCMNNNYYSSVYPAQAMMNIWIGEDKESPVPPVPKLRRIIFVNSSATLAPIPGYLAYSAAKSAQRAFADTMRLEVTRYSGPKSTYSVQCVFAHNFITPTFLIEQKNKPELTKKLEGSTGKLSDLEKKFPYAEKIAPTIVASVAKGDYAVMDNRMDPQLLWANMIGPSPRRGWGVVDTLLAGLMGIFLFPFVRRGWEKMCKGDALREG
ncbi:short chain dehydrogenase [Tricladium varicosporioides]|nr:short chain dehydrogenase [Hymenoscyphus varicosporioides]